MNRDFDDGKSYPYRRGAENDEQHYQEAFENLGFKVVKHFDKTAKQIQDIISQCKLKAVSYLLKGQYFHVR